MSIKSPPGVHAQDFCSELLHTKPRVCSILNLRWTGWGVSNGAAPAVGVLQKGAFWGKLKERRMVSLKVKAERSAITALCVLACHALCKAWCLIVLFQGTEEENSGKLSNNQRWGNWNGRPWKDLSSLSWKIVQRLQKVRIFWKNKFLMRTATLNSFR